ncbi:MAG: holo-ACP synthase [Pseudomonadota bacterium]
MISIGTDILQVSRVEQVLKRQGERFMERILTPSERKEYSSSAKPERLLAKRFAAKEAVAKALGTGIGRGVGWQDITVAHDQQGAPRIILSGGALDVASRLGGTRVEISISDEAEYVVAFAVLAD